MAEIDLGKVVGPQGEPGIKGDTGKEGPQGPPGPEGVVDGNSAITFSTPAAYEEPVSGNSISVLFGRFKRWVMNLQDNIGSLSSLKTPAKASVVDGVNANYDTIAQLEQDVGNPTDLTTSSKEVVGAVNELNSALLNKQSYPDYSKISTIISGGVGTKTYTCTENGFVQFAGASGNNSVKPEIDLSINGVYVFKYRTGYQTTYVKATSGLFPVKQGDVIKCVIQSSFVNDESVRFYQLRY